ncbi:hypothetical protein ILUMI_19771, partial [Ignelater luminosus]
MKTLLISLLLLTVFGNIHARVLESGLELDNVEYQQRIFEGTINDTINSYVAKLKAYDPVAIPQVAQDVSG